jgi:hypothetical protein
LELIAEFDRRNGWSEGGMKSCAHWLNWKCGIAIGAAREKVRVARALEEPLSDDHPSGAGRFGRAKRRADPHPSLRADRR